MKNLLFLFLSCLCVSLFAQDTTYTLSDGYFGYHQTNDVAWDIQLPDDTLHASSNDDTLVINLPHDLANHFIGVMSIGMDTIALTSDLEGTVEIREAQCYTCPYTTIETATIPNLGVFTRDTFDVHDLRMQIRIIGTTGDGVTTGYITLKPAGSW